MGFFDGLGQLAGIAGTAGVANPTISGALTGVGLLSSMFGGGQTAAQKQAQQDRQAAQGFYNDADGASKYYADEASSAKNQQYGLEPKYQDAFNQALAAHSGAYTSYAPNQSQGRADRLSAAYNQTNNDYLSAQARTKADLESRGLDAGSSVGAGLAGYDSRNLAQANSQNVLGVNEQIRQEGIGNADYSLNAYENALNNARNRASGNTGAQIGYDESRAGGLMGQSMYNQGVAQNEQYQKQGYLASIGSSMKQAMAPRGAAMPAPTRTPNAFNPYGNQPGYGYGGYGYGGSPYGYNQGFYAGNTGFNNGYTGGNLIGGNMYGIGGTYNGAGVLGNNGGYGGLGSGGRYGGDGGLGGNYSFQHPINQNATQSPSLAQHFASYSADPTLQPNGMHT